MAKKHPLQPMAIDDHGTLRFQENAIVRFMADKIGLNELSRMNFSASDWRQLAQLIGYSIDGYSTLSYVDDKEWSRVEKRLEKESP